MLHAARSARALLLPLPSLPRWARAGRPGIAGPGGWLERYPMYRLIRARPVSARTTPCARGLPPSVNKSGAGRGPWPPPPSCAATHVKCSIIETSRARWTQAGRRGTGGSRTRARVPARCAVRGDADADAGQARAVPCRTRTSARLRRGAGLGDEDVSSSPLPPASGDASRRRPRIQAVQRRGRRRARTVTSRSLRRSRARLPPFSYSRAPAPPLVAQATFARAREAVHAVHRGPPRHCFAPDPVGSVQAAATTSRSASNCRRV